MAATALPLLAASAHTVSRAVLHHAAKHALAQHTNPPSGFALSPTAVAIWIGIAIITGAIGRSAGQSFAAWFIFALIFPPAMIVAIIVAVRRSGAKGVATALQEAFTGPNTRVNMHTWLCEPLAPLQSSRLNLSPGEASYLEQPTTMSTIHKHTSYVGGYAGPSVRVARGLWLRAGAFRGQPVTSTAMEPDDKGTVCLTNHRFVFVGAIKTIEVPFKKIASVEGYTDGLKLDITNHAPIIFVTGSKQLQSYYARLSADTLQTMSEDEFSKMFPGGPKPSARPTEGG